MMQDTWHIVSGPIGVTCHVHNESNMSSNELYRILRQSEFHVFRDIGSDVGHLAHCE